MAVQLVSSIPMASDKLPNSFWSVRNLKFKFFNFLQLEADQMPAWLVVVILLFLIAVLYIVCLYPLPAILGGIGGMGKSFIAKLRG